jgi:hypothetical protein
LSTTQFPGRERRCELPRRHQQREVERDDLADDAQRLLEVVRVGVVVDLVDRPLLRPDHRGEVAEVIDGERDVGSEGLADRLAVLPALGDRQHLEVLLDRVCDPVQDLRALGGRPGRPVVLGGVSGVERELDVLGGRERHLGERLAGDRRDVLRVAAFDRGDPVSPDEVLVPGLQLDRAARQPRCLVARGLLDGCHRISFREEDRAEVPGSNQLLALQTPRHRGGSGPPLPENPY